MSFKVGIYCRKSSGVERDNISLKIQKEEGERKWGWVIKARGWATKERGWARCLKLD